MRSLGFVLLQSLVFTAAVAAAEPQGSRAGSLRRLAPVEVTAHETPQIELDRLAGFERGEDGALFQATRFSVRGASAVRARLENVRLPEGASLYIYGIGDSGEAIAVQGPYKGSGPTASGEFWSLSVPGEDVVIEIQVAGEPLASLPYDVAELAAGNLEESSAAGASAPETSTAKGTAYYRGFNVEYEVKGGQAVIEGDIEIGPVESVEAARAEAPSKSRQSISITSTAYRWPDGIMPYVIDPTMGNTQRITDAVNHWNTLLAGVVKLVPRTNESVYVNFYRPTDPGVCSSYVGRLGIAGQNISIGDYCSAGNAIHEIGHAFGLYHEQTREDRDRYVVINFANIISTATSNFNQVNSTASDVGAYDYNSIMHYGAYAFSANGLPTITTIPDGIPIGQRNGLSAGDIAGITTIYPQSTTTTTPPPPTTTTQVPTISVTVTSNPVGATLTIDGVQMAAPASVTWAQGTSHTISAPNNFTVGGKKNRFVSWSNGGSRNQTVTAGSTTMYVANYSTSYQLRAEPAVQGTGTVTVSPVSEDGYYTANTTVTLNATPAPGYCFTGWTGLLPGTPAQTTVTMTNVQTAIANFTQGGGSLRDVANSLVARINGGQWRVGMVSGNCPVTVRSSASWITGSFRGNQAMVAVSPYTDGTSWYRTGTISFGNQTISVWQFKY